MLHGEAGVGKSALLRYATRQASGFRVVEVAGVESEMELPYAGLHQLSAPMLMQVDALREPQQAALRVAFGHSSGGAPDRFVVALAILSLLAHVADQRPLLAFVDDAEWLDGASGQVLGFVARRLLAESVAIVFGVREGSDDEGHSSGLPEMSLDGLPDEDARALLETVVPGRLDEGIRDRIIAETRGNPLALLELPRGMTAAELPVASAFPRPATSGITSRSGTPPSRQPARFHSAIDAAGCCRSGRRRDAPGAPPRRSASNGKPRRPPPMSTCSTSPTRVRFRHPLVRSAVYQSASAAERRPRTRALAAAIDPEVDPDRRAWHRAEAATGADEAVAPSWSSPRVGRRHAAGWRQRLRSSSARRA